MTSTVALATSPFRSFNHAHWHCVARHRDVPRLLQLGLERSHGPAHQAGSDSLLTSNVFFQIRNRFHCHHRHSWPPPPPHHRVHLTRQHQVFQRRHRRLQVHGRAFRLGSERSQAGKYDGLIAATSRSRGRCCCRCRAVE
jgi:hypothetical protein